MAGELFLEVSHFKILFIEDIDYGNSKGYGFHSFIKPNYLFLPIQEHVESDYGDIIDSRLNTCKYARHNLACLHEIFKDHSLLSSRLICR